MFFYCRRTSLLENFNSKMLISMPLKEMPLSKYLFFFYQGSCSHCIARYFILVTVLHLPGFACLDIYRRESFIIIS